MKLQTTYHSIETGILAASDKIRLLVVFSLFSVIGLSPQTSLSVPSAAYSALAVWALLALYTYFLIDWVQMVRSGRALLVAAAVIIGDLFCTFMLVYGTGGISSGFQVLFVLDIILGALLFTRLEIALITGLASSLYALVAILSFRTLGQIWTASATVMCYVICAWLAYLVASVIRREKMANERLIRNLHEGVMLFDADGRVLVANPLIGTFCGMPIAEISGHFAHKLYNAPNSLLSWLVEDVVLSDAHSFDPSIREARFKQEDGTVVYRCTTVPCRGGEDHVLGWIVLCQDITEVQAGQRPDKLNSQLPYELATAIANMRAVSEALYGISDIISSPQQEQILSTIRAQTDTLRKMVADLLDVNVIEQDDVQLALRPVEVSSLLTTVRRLCRLRSRTASVQVVVRDEVNAGLIRADEEKLWQVLVWACNRLVDCAEPGGSVTLRAEQYDGHVRFIAETSSVKGNQHVSPWDEDASTADNDTITASQCQQIVELHGGSVQWHIDDGRVQLAINVPAAGPQPGGDEAQRQSAQEPVAKPQKQMPDPVNRTIHLLNNLLATIDGHVSLALAIPEIPTFYKALQTTAKCVQRAKSAVEQLKEFSGTRVRKGGRGAILLGLEAAINELQSSAESNPPVVIRDYSAQPAPVSITPEQATRLFAGLLRYCLIPEDADEGLEVLVQVAPSCFTNDTEGVYISILPSILSQALAEDINQGIESPGAWFHNEPTNLLSEARQILTQNGGRVRSLVMDNRFVGCQVYFPLADDVRPTMPQVINKLTVEKAAPTQQQLRVLVVDDEKSLVEIYRKYLSSIGCDVTIATNGTEALNILGQSRFDLVFTDVIMPGASAEAIIKAVNGNSDPCPVVVMTGQVDDSIQETYAANGAYAVLRKPFSLAHLSTIIDEVRSSRNSAEDSHPVMTF